MAWLLAVLLGTIAASNAVDNAALRKRRQSAAHEFHDGILLLHALSRMDIAADGYRQDPYFYYLTGQENAVSAVLAIDGKSGESWLFLPSQPPFSKAGLKPTLVPGPDAARQTGIDHVVDWTDLQAFLADHAASSPAIYYTREGLGGFDEMPSNLLSPKDAGEPLWLQIILERWPSLAAKDGTNSLNNLMAVQDLDELSSVHSVAKATVTAINTGMRAIRPGVSQRAVESAVESACWAAGSHGSNFWPWVMSGENAVFPNPLASLASYDHLDRKMQSGELVRLDVGCEYKHYLGDLGRIVPVSGHYTDDQRNLNIFVAAYRKGVSTLRAGVTSDSSTTCGAKNSSPIAARPKARSRNMRSTPGRNVRTFRFGRFTPRTCWPRSLLNLSRRHDHQLRADRFRRWSRILPRGHVRHSQRWSGTTHTRRPLHKAEEIEGAMHESFQRYRKLALVLCTWLALTSACHRRTESSSYPTGRASHRTSSCATSPFTARHSTAKCRTGS
jgi:Xaa-Pro aminopeptidase